MNSLEIKLELLNAYNNVSKIGMDDMFKIIILSLIHIIDELDEN